RDRAYGAGADALLLVRPGEPPRATWRLRHDARACGPASDGLGTADPADEDASAHVPIRCGECGAEGRSDSARTRLHTVTLRRPPVKETVDGLSRVLAGDGSASNPVPIAPAELGARGALTQTDQSQRPD